jgi:hypothetical protein
MNSMRPIGITAQRFSSTSGVPTWNAGGAAPGAVCRGGRSSSARMRRTRRIKARRNSKATTASGSARAAVGLGIGGQHDPVPGDANARRDALPPRSGRSSRSTLMFTNCAFVSAAAVVSSSEDSWAMTWHQWQAEYPTESRMGLFSERARSSASGPHGCQATGLSACWRRQAWFRSPGRSWAGLHSRILS